MEFKVLWFQKEMMKIMNLLIYWIKWNLEINRILMIQLLLKMMMTSHQLIISQHFQEAVQAKILLDLSHKIFVTDLHNQSFLGAVSTWPTMAETWLTRVVLALILILLVKIALISCKMMSLKPMKKKWSREFRTFGALLKNKLLKFNRSTRPNLKELLTKLLN